MANNTYSEEWFQIANKDFARVSVRLAEDDTEDAAFHLQQALEKGLKGFLIARGWQLKRTHDLESLLDDAVDFEPLLEPFRPLCNQVNGYYLTERYPGVDVLPETEAIEAILPDAEALLRKLGMALEA